MKTLIICCLLLLCAGCDIKKLSVKLPPAFSGEFHKQGFASRAIFYAQSDADDRSWFTVEYSFDCGGTWERYTSVIWFDVPTLDERNFPYLTDNLNDAIKLAKSLTEDGVRAHNQQEDARWARLVAGRETKEEKAMSRPRPKPIDTVIVFGCPVGN